MEVYPTEWVCICVWGGGGTLLVYALKTLSCNAKNIRTTGPDRDGAETGAGCAVACSKFNEVWNARLLPQVWSQLAAGWQGKAGRTGLKCATNKCAQVEQAKAGRAGGQRGSGVEGRHLSWQLCNFVKVKHKVVGSSSARATTQCGVSIRRALAVH